MQKIEQKHYGNLEVDTREKDIVQVWMDAKDPQVVQIERENLKALIEILQKQIHNGTN